MTAKINITTPAGKSLEGFPVISYAYVDVHNLGINNFKTEIMTEDGDLLVKRTDLNKGDIITIEVL